MQCGLAGRRDELPHGVQTVDAFLVPFRRVTDDTWTIGRPITEGHFGNWQYPKATLAIQNGDVKFAAMHISFRKPASAMLLAAEFGALPHRFAPYDHRLV